jgi:hypothetical protein
MPSAPKKPTSIGSKRFILFHDKRHPRQMGTPEIEAFLTHLAVDRKDIKTTVIYTHVLNRGPLAIHSPLDQALARATPSVEGQTASGRV